MSDDSALASQSRRSYPYTMRTPTPSPQKSLYAVVFEALNPARREVYIGTAAGLSIGGLTEPRFMSPRLAHWLPGESLEIRLVDPRVSTADCGDFIERRARELRYDGWTPITDF